ncbi:alpha/beta fold hydrolase [Emticicia sp. C21]|uniref:alpha/beta hydrolase family protein n=1 Tax=Emticicia sp. C21 TaxID=2302915 RepID=UPI000E349320|nr:alpha/beta fold hydrolase [Emticicia sp. C21]RFS16520.1 alpha/beta hydrolase [Emticicia sp. C21]
MKPAINSLVLSLLFIFTCLLNLQTVFAQSQYPVKLDSVRWIDEARKRVIPVAFYSPEINKKVKILPLIIFSHGYSANQGRANLEYSYLTNHLASEGYFVASIQHELPTDSLLPMTGKPQIVRRSNWERGAENILFVLKELKKLKPELDYKHIILMGHSNGGDMTALFAHKYPDLVSKAITLDNRRMALPRTKKPEIYSLRSSDQPADEDVLPTEKEQKQFGMSIIKLPDTIHNHMDNDANEPQRKEIIDYVMKFLKK